MIKLIKYKTTLLTIALLFGLGSASCSSKSAQDSKIAPLNGSTQKMKAHFSADSAYNNIAAQVSFGKRVPGTDAHKQCAEWIVNTLEANVDTVIVQTGNVTAFNGDKLPVSNIFGQLNPDRNDRILLLAHYDTRPWADAETDELKRKQPIDGANDGASGVGVLLELARVLKANEYKGGVDFLFVDAEDYGMPSHMDITGDSEDSWCLGTQLWTANMPYKQGQRPRFAILLDMVGGVNARFHREYFSELYVAPINDIVWSAAKKLGYDNYFINETGNPITDDHIYLLKASIPAIDIIENRNIDTGSFNPTWHTLDDNIDNIDRETLKAVGETVTEVIMNL